MQRQLFDVGPDSAHAERAGQGLHAMPRDMLEDEDGNLIRNVDELMASKARVLRGRPGPLFATSDGRYMAASNLTENLYRSAKSTGLDSGGF